MSEITDKDLTSIYSSLSSCSPLVRGLAERLRRVEEELERERIRLAACGVAALCNTEESMAQQVIGSDNQYYSASYGDVVDAVKREIQHRAENTALRERMKRMEEALRFYAHERIWVEIESDRGKIAQAALKEGGE